MSFPENLEILRYIVLPDMGSTGQQTNCSAQWFCDNAICFHFPEPGFLCRRGKYQTWYSPTSFLTPELSLISLTHFKYHHVCFIMISVGELFGTSLFIPVLLAMLAISVALDPKTGFTLKKGEKFWYKSVRHYVRITTSYTCNDIWSVHERGIHVRLLQA